MAKHFNVTQIPHKEISKLLSSMTQMGNCLLHKYGKEILFSQFRDSLRELYNFLLSQLYRNICLRQAKNFWSPEIDIWLWGNTSPDLAEEAQFILSQKIHFEPQLSFMQCATYHQQMMKATLTYHAPTDEFEIEYPKTSKRQLTGVYYTPQKVIELTTKYSVDQWLSIKGTSLPNPQRQKQIRELKVIDPSCGSGLFLLAALRTLTKHLTKQNSSTKPVAHSYQDAMFFVLEHCIYGMDIDPVAISLSRLILWWECQTPRIPLTNNIQCQNSLLSLATETSFFDIVIGNPPYLFLSGRGSPVKKLIKNHQLEAAAALQDYHRRCAELYPEASQGCLDYHKWFVALSCRIGKGGIIGLVIPSSWLSLPRYDDIHQLLRQNGVAYIIDYGFSAFPHLTVPTCSVICHPDGRPRYYNLKSFTDIPGDLPAGTLCEVMEGRIKLFQHPLAKNLYQNSPLRLGDIISIHEGSHATFHEASTVDERVRQFKDWEMRSFAPVQWRWVKKPSRSITKERHIGERILLRKTGDSIVCTLVNSSYPIIAHQNVYIIQTKGAIKLAAIQALLASRLMTFLYQAGPMGQRKRPMAQFRISALKNLPIPSLEKIQHIETELIDLCTSLQSHNSEEKQDQLQDTIVSLYGLSHTVTCQIKDWFEK